LGNFQPFNASGNIHQIARLKRLLHTQSGHFLAFPCNKNPAEAECKYLLQVGQFWVQINMHKHINDFTHR
jgi:hypothetical protein